MTNPDYAAISILVDRSGSMFRLADDASGSIQKFIEEQAAAPGQCTIRLSQFNTEYENVYPSTVASKVKPYRLQARGGTALLDAWGRAMTEFGKELADLPEHSRPGKVFFVVVTDGQENASHEYSRELIFDMVEEQKSKWKWEFIFLASGQDAVATGAQYGVGASNSLSYGATRGGTQTVYAAASASVLDSRAGGQGGFTEADRQKAMDSTS